MKRLTPKEKASELIELFHFPDVEYDIGMAMCVKGAIALVEEMDRFIVKSTPKDNPYANLMLLEYWMEVKEELLKK